MKRLIARIAPPAESKVKEYSEELFVPIEPTWLFANDTLTVVFNVAEVGLKRVRVVGFMVDAEEEA